MTDAFGNRIPANQHPRRLPVVVMRRQHDRGEPSREDLARMRSWAKPAMNGDALFSLIGGVVSLAVLATLGMVCLKIAAWAWS